MIRRMSLRLLSLAAGLTLVACSDAAAPSPPADVPAHFSKAETDAAKAHREELKRQAAERKAYFKAMKEANKDHLKAAKAEWKEWKHDWREQYKLEKEAWKREHPGEKGGPEIQLLRCEPRDYDADVAIIGPDGGTLHVGDHELVIPAGAVEHEMLITAEAPTSSLVDVRFQPHGLTFLQPARLTLSYKNCVRPTTANFLIAYLGHGHQVTELPPSVDFEFDKEVQADIDHFSRYAVAW